ncbi:Two component transcriptional regulator, LuxR family [Burkholderiales bacterium]|jgi:NarL family two-component system response regulator LiaR|nr:Two component transcriptional regulator, LuxR family [Burkholderiales bacterium]
METQKKVLLVEDHDLIRLGTGMLLESLGEVRCEIKPCRSLDEARTACRSDGPFDLVLLDLNLADSKGLQGLRVLRDEFPNLPIAMLTGTQDEFVIRQAQAMGAIGYLLKSWTPDQVKAALLSLLRPPGGPARATISERFPKLAGTAHYDRVAELGPRHLQILELILEGCSNQEISKATELSLGTVKNYVSAILLALDVESRAHLISLFH